MDVQKILIEQWKLLTEFGPQDFDRGSFDAGYIGGFNDAVNNISESKTYDHLFGELADMRSQIATLIEIMTEVSEPTEEELNEMDPALAERIRRIKEERSNE